MTDPNFYIETPNLFLSYFIPTNSAHCTFLVALYNSPLFIEMEGKTAIVDEEKARERIGGKFIDDHKRWGYGQYLVSLKADATTKFSEAKPIGSVCLTKGTDADSLPIPDIGFCILPEMNGRGYATEGAKGLLDYVKREKGIHEVFGFTDPKNVGSQRVMEKLGMEDQGIKKLFMFGGVSGHVFTLPGMKTAKEYGFE
jgi:RimJ/RimL family protein N-acetyltransferase